MLNIVISFDYELFLGKNFKSNKEVLFDPCDKLISLCEKYGIYTTCFADVCSIFAHEKYGLLDYKNDIEAQMKDMTKRGHDVELHIHPNWLLSEYKNGEWIFDKTHYRVHSFGFDTSKKINAYSILKKGKDYLEELLQSVDKDYKCLAYRAGGYSAQPHDEIFKYLRLLGVIVDSSVSRGSYDLSDIAHYDYRNLPDSLNWWVTPNKDFSYCGNANEGGLYEVPLLQDKNKWYKMIDRKYLRIIRSTPLNGNYISSKVKENKYIGYLKKIVKYPFRLTPVSFDGMTHERMIDYLKKLEKEHSNENAYVSLICHPKVMDDSVRANMEEVLKALTNDDNFRFVTMADIAKTISK